MGEVYDRSATEPTGDTVRVEVVRRAPGGGPAVPAFRTAAGAKGGCAAVAGLLMLCVLAFVPGLFSLPPVDRDESRFAQASRQMFESAALPESLRDPARHGGGLLVPMVQDKPRLNKPPLIYWAQAASAAALTAARPHADRIWMYRAPSLLAAIAVVLLTWRLGVLVFDAQTGAVAGALIAVSPVIAWEAHQARADMLLVAMTVLAQLAMWKMFANGKRQVMEGRAAEEGAEAGGAREGGASERGAGGMSGGLKWAVIFWVAIAAGIMTKGPITPMVAGFTAIGLSAATGRWRWLLRLRPELGVIIVAAAVAPWVWGVARQVGWDVYIATIKDEVWGRSLSPREGHWGPPGYHTLLMPLLLWPGSLLTIPAVVLAVRSVLAMNSGTGKRVTSMRVRLAGLRTAEPAYLFLLAWIVPSWIIFELVSTKLPHYTMPLYPGLAILSAHAVFAAEAGLVPGLRTWLARTGFWAWVVLGVVLAMAGLAGLAAVSMSAGWLGKIGLAAVAVFFGALVIVNLRLLVRSWQAGKFARAQLCGVLVGLATVIVVIGICIPRLIGLSPAVVRAIDDIDPTGSRPLALVKYHEDSMIFLTRGRAQRINLEGMQDWLDAHPGGLVVMPLEQVAEQLYFVKSPVITGFNYAKGRVERLVVVGREWGSDGVTK